VYRSLKGLKWCTYCRCLRKNLKCHFLQIGLNNWLFHFFSNRLKCHLLQLGLSNWCTLCSTGAQALKCKEARVLVSSCACTCRQNVAFLLNYPSSSSTIQFRNIDAFRGGRRGKLQRDKGLRTQDRVRPKSESIRINLSDSIWTQDRSVTGIQGMSFPALYPSLARPGTRPGQAGFCI
jgi:hypothetical protein